MDFKNFKDKYKDYAPDPEQSSGNNGLDAFKRNYAKYAPTDAEVRHSSQYYSTPVTTLQEVNMNPVERQRRDAVNLLMNQNKQYDNLFAQSPDDGKPVRQYYDTIAKSQGYMEPSIERGRMVQRLENELNNTGTGFAKNDREDQIMKQLDNIRKYDKEFYTDKYNTLNAREDFEQNSAYVENDDARHTRINQKAGTGLADDMKNNSFGIENGLPDKESYLSSLNKNELANYNYLYNTEGKNAADNYLSFISKDLKERRSNAKSAITDMAMSNEGPLDDIVMNAVSVLQTPKKGLAYLQAAADYVANGEYDKNDDFFDSVRLSSDIRNNTSEKILGDSNDPAFWRKASNFLYQTGMSMADFLTNSLMTGGFGGLNEYLDLGVMGAGAAADFLYEAKDKGYTDGQAMILGTLAGAAEILTEKFSLEALLKTDIIRDKGIKYVFINAFTEGMEEAGSDFLNGAGGFIIDNLTDQQLGDWLIAYNEAKKNDPTGTKADWLGATVKSLGGDMALSILGGALSGGIMGGASYWGNVRQQKSIGADINNNYQADGSTENAVIENEIQKGLNSKDEYVQKNADRALNQYAEAVDSGTTMDNRELGRLAQLNAQEEANYFDNVKNQGEEYYKLRDQVWADDVLTEAVSEYVETGDIPEESLRRITNSDSALEIVAQQTGIDIAELKAMDSDTRKTYAGAMLMDMANDARNEYKAREPEMKRQKQISSFADTMGPIGAQTMESEYERAGIEDTSAYVKAVNDLYSYGAGNATQNITQNDIEGIKAEYGLQAMDSATALKAVYAGQNDAQRGNINVTETSSGGNARWTYSVGTGGQGSKVQSERAKASAGKTSGRNGLQGRKGLLTSQINEVKSQKLSAKDLGFAAGTDTVRNYKYEKAYYDEEMKLVSKAFENKGYETVFYSGLAEVKDEKGISHAIRGEIDPTSKKIFIQADNMRLSPQQIAMHEEFHLLLNSKSDRERAIEDAKAALWEGGHEEAEFNQLAAWYVSHHGWEGSEMTAEDIAEEILADAYAGIDVWDYLTAASGATKYTDAIREYAKKTFTGEESGTIGDLKVRNSTEVGQMVYGAVVDREGNVIPSVDTIQEFAHETPVARNSYDLYYNEDQKQTIRVTKTGFSAAAAVIRKSGREILADAYRENGFGNGVIKQRLEQMDEFADFMKKAGLEYHFIGLDDVNHAKLVLDRRTGKITISAMVKNGDYPVNFDFTKICAKREAISNVINELAARPGRNGGASMLEEIDLSAENIYKINEILIDEGYDTACLGCFVEARRANIQDWAQSFVKKYNEAVKKANPDAEFFNFSSQKVANAANMKEDEVKKLTSELSSYKKDVKNETQKKTNELKVNKFVKNVSGMQKLLRVSDLITAEGRTNLHAASPELESLILSHWGTSTPKSMEVFTPYNNEIALMTGNPGGYGKSEANPMRRYLKKIAGVRSQSFSDFQIQHFLDVAQKTADLEARRFVAHTYTKVASRAWLFGMTGEKINLSVMFNVDPSVDWRHAGLRADGSYFVGDKATADAEVAAGRQRTPNQSIDFNEAVRIQRSKGYSGNCGIIGVGYSYHHIMKMLSDPDIRYIIPYHKSGLPPVYAAQAHLDLVTDYTAVQNTLAITGFKALKKADAEVPSYASWGQKQMAGNKKNTDFTGGAEKYVAKKEVTITDENGEEVKISELYTFKNAFNESGLSGQEYMRQLLSEMNEQNIAVNTKTADKGAGHSTFNLYEELERTANDRSLTEAERKDAPRITANKYIEWCLNNNTLPLFYEFSGHENYYKLLYDFNVYDCVTEEYAPQQDVTSTYPENVLDIVNGYMKAENARNEIQAREHFEPALERIYQKTRNSEEADSEGNYLTEGQKEFFKDSKARDENGKLLRLYHGTKRAGFTVFNTEGDSGMGTFLTPYQEVAESYSKDETLYAPDEPVDFETFEEMVEGYSSGDWSLSEKDGKYILTDDDDKAHSFDSIKEAQAYFQDQYISEFSGSSANYVLYANIKNPLIVEGDGAWWDNIPNWDKVAHTFDEISLSDQIDDDLWEISYVEDGGESITEQFTTDELYEKFGRDAAVEVMNGSDLSTVYIDEFGNSLNMSTNDWTWEAYYGGHDGVIFKNIVDGGDDASDVYVVFNPNQIKSIFNTNPTLDDDIRYSEEADSTGAKLTDEQKEFFKDSKARDKNGNLLRLYHGSNQAGFTVFAGESIFTSSLYSIAAGYGDVDPYGKRNLFDQETKEGKVYSLYANVKNPLIVDAANSEGTKYDTISVSYDKNTQKFNIEALEGSKTRRFSFYTKSGTQESILESLKKHFDEKTSNLIIKQFSFETDGKYTFETFKKSKYVLKNKMYFENSARMWNNIMFNGKVMTTDEIAEYAHDNGYDGVIINNVIDDIAGVGTGGATDVVVFNPNQLKLTDNTSPTENSDIRYSEESDSEGNKLTEEQNTYFKDSKVRDKNGNLLLMHHGTKAEFYEFKREFIGSTGAFEGTGFNFTPSHGRATSYGGNVLSGYINVTKPLSATEKTFTVRSLANAIMRIDPTGDNIIANYAQNTRDYGKESFVRREALTTAKAIFEYAESDVDIYSDMSAAAGGDVNLIAEFERMGYDGLIHYDENGDVKTVITFNSNQFKDQDNLSPTNSPDRRYSEETSINFIDEDHTNEEINRFHNYIESVDKINRNFEDFDLDAAAEEAWLESLTLDDVFTDLKKNTGKRRTAAEMAQIIAGDSLNLTDNMATYTDERIDRIIRERKYGANKSDSYVAYINPKDFLRATNSNVSRFVQNETASGNVRDLSIADLQKETQTPYLSIEMRSNGAKVIGHEGRHRMFALAAAGIDRAPVVLVDRANRYNEKAPIDRLVLSGQEYGETRNRHKITLENLVPATEQYKDQLKERFGGEGKVRFSEESTSSVEEDLRKQNEYLKAQYASVLQQVRTGGKTEDLRKNANRLANTLRKDYKSSMKQADIQAAINKLVNNYIITGEQNRDLAYDKAKTEAVKIAHDIIWSAKELNTDAKERYDSLRKTLMDNNGIVLNPADREDMGDYITFRTKNFGKINLKNSGTPVDTFYTSVLTPEFGEDLFPSSITHPADQLLRIGEIVQELSQIYENPFSADMAGAVEYCANDILKALSDGTVVSDPTSESTINTAKYEEGRQRGIDYANWAIKRQADLQKERTKKVLDHYKENVKARKEVSADRQKLLRIMRRLKNKKLPAVSRALLMQYIGEMDTVSVGITQKKLNDLRELKDRYEQMAHDDPNFIRDERIEEQLRRLSTKKISELSQEDVADLLEVLLNIENEMRIKDITIDTEDKRHVYLQTVDSVTDLRMSKGIKEGTVKGTLDSLFINSTLSPLRAVHRMVGYNENSPLYQRTKDLQMGEVKMLDFQRRAGELFKEFTEDSKFIESITGKNAKMITYNGIQLTPAMRMSLYLHSKNPENLRHVTRGGVKVPNWTQYKKGNLGAAYSQGSQIVKFTVEDVNNIISGMTGKEKAFADAAHNYFNKMSQEEINAVSEKLKGYSLAEVENYFPINVDQNFTSAEFGSIKVDGTIEGMGFLTERVVSSNPIYLRDMTDVLNQSIEMTSKYVGMAIPVRNFNKLLKTTSSVTEEGMAALQELKEAKSQQEIWAASRKLRENKEYLGTTMTEVIEQKWGDQGRNYIEKMMHDVQNPKPAKDGWAKVFGQLRSAYAGSVLSLNLSVAMKQAASYPTAAAVLGWKPLAQAMTQFGKVDMNKINKYTPLQWYRSKGFSSPELATIRADVNSNALQKAMGSKWLNWITDMDVWTTRKLWKASENYVKQNNKALNAGTDEYYKAVAEIYNRVITETQPNYTTMERPALLRSEDSLVGTMMMFKTQPFQNFNVLYDAAGNFDAKRTAFKNNPNSKTAEADYKGAKKDLARAISSQIVQFLTFALMTAAWNMLRRKKEDYSNEEGQITAASFSEKIAKDMISGTASMVPLGGDLYEVFSSAFLGDKYYGFDNITASALDDLFNAFLKTENGVADIFDSIRNGEEVNWNKARFDLESSLSAASKVAGVPYDNVKNLVNIALENALLTAEGKYRGRFDYLCISKKISSATKKEYYNVLYDAYMHDKKAYEYIYNKMRTDYGEDFSEAAIKSQMKKRGVTIK